MLNPPPSPYFSCFSSNPYYLSHYSGHSLSFFSFITSCPCSLSLALAFPIDRNKLSFLTNLCLCRFLLSFLYYNLSTSSLCFSFIAPLILCPPLSHSLSLSPSQSRARTHTHTFSLPYILIVLLVELQTHSPLSVLSPAPPLERLC